MHHANILRMTRRVALTTAWFLAGWMLGAMAAFLVGLPELIAPIAAVSAALIAYRPESVERRLRPASQALTSQSH